MNKKKVKKEKKKLFEFSISTNCTRKEAEEILDALILKFHEMNLEIAGGFQEVKNEKAP